MARLQLTNFTDAFTANLKQFLELDYNPDKNLVVWDAGSTGKTIAKTLIKKNIPFDWICDKQNKIGHNIYGKIIQSHSFLETLKNPQSNITVANKKFNCIFYISVI